MALAGGRTDGFAAGSLVIGAQFEPRSEALDCGKLTHICADLADDRLRQVKAETPRR